jgi:hypothetical protein
VRNSTRGAIRDLEYIRDVMIGRLIEELKWVDGYAYGKRTTSGERVSSSGHSDPTGDSVVDPVQQNVRASLRSAARLISSAYSDLKGATGALHRAGSAMGRHEREDTRHLEPLVNPVELAEAHRNKERRARSGQGYGVS